MYRVCLVSAAVLVAGTVAADDWPHWLGPKGDAVWRETGIADKFPTGGPPLVWKKPVGLGYAGPTVAGGKVYVTDFVPKGGEDLTQSGFKKANAAGTEHVYCLDAKTGEKVWAADYPAEYTISYPGGPRCTPAVDGGHVYTLGAMGDLRCYTTDKGTLVWSKNFPKDYKAAVPLWGFAAHPLVDGDKLVCLVAGSDNRLVVAFDKKTGKELWTAEHSPPTKGGYCPPTIEEFGGRRQLIVLSPQAVAGLDPETGKRLWRVPFDEEVQANLTVPSPRKVGTDGLFITTFYDGALFLKVGADRAEVVWKAKKKGEGRNQTTTLNSIMPTPFVEGDYVYGVCSYGQLRCLNLKTGERVWETMKATRGALTPPRVAAQPEADETERWSNAFLTKQGDRFFLSNEQGDLIIARLTPKGYEEIDRANLIEPTNRANTRRVLWVPPAFADKCVFVRNDKEVACYRLGK
jgi:outer membrane protein assembly factor BamB